MSDFTHFNDQGRAKMVDVGEKNISRRTAVAAARVLVNDETFSLIQSGGMKKGDVLTVAQIAGVMGAKRTPDLIPMCHPLSLTNAAVTVEVNDAECEIKAICRAITDGKTGVEMEALTGVSTALLTIYDMCKAIDKRMVIREIHLVSKEGGKSGQFVFKED